jgi:hypothetical protein
VARDFIASLPVRSGETASMADTVPPTPREVLARYVEAVGGRTRLSALETRILRGREVDDRPYRGPRREIPLEAVAAFPDRWSVTHTDTLVEREWSDGQRVWRTRNGAAEATGGPVRTKASFLLDPRGPLRVEEYFPGLHLVGREVRNGRQVWVLNCDLDPTHYALSFDVETGLLVQIGWYWTLEEYREVDGVLLATRVVQSRKGGHTAWIWDEIVHNRTLPRGTFRGR